MELRHLRYFIAAAEELHVGHAALRLHIAQPPLSRQIHDLEREVGTALFSRRNRRIQLTAAGEAFLDGARQTLAQAELAIDDARRAARGEIGRLALGFVGSAAYAVLPRLLRAYRAQAPAVALSLAAMTTQEQVLALREQRIRIGILRPPIDEPRIALHTMVYEPLVAVLPVSHPLAAREQVALRDLAEEPFILYPRADGPGVHDTIVGCCRRAGFSPRIAQEAGEMQTIAGLVAGGIGVALVIAQVEHARASGVAYRPLADDIAPWALALAWRQDDDSPVTQTFLAAAEVALAAAATETPMPPHR
jgi:DNA-binding transcriptional LysR family regulator